MNRYLIPFPAAGGRYPVIIGMIQSILYQIKTIDPDAKIHASGVSSGAVCAIMLIIGLFKGLNIDDMHKEFIKIMRNKKVDFFDGIELLIRRYVTNKDVKHIVNKRVHIGYCRLCAENGLEFIVVSEFKDVNDLVGAFRASAHYPLLLREEMYYEYRGDKCVDGVFIHESILLPGYRNIKIGSSVFDKTLSTDRALDASKEKYKRLFKLGRCHQQATDIEWCIVETSPISTNCSVSTVWTVFCFGVSLFMSYY